MVFDRGSTRIAVQGFVAGASHPVASEDQTQPERQK